MKSSTFFTLTLSLLPLMAWAGTPVQKISGVVICAAECNSPILGIKNHDEAKIGKIHYAPAVVKNMGNSSICMTDSESLELIVDRIEGGGQTIAACSEAVAGKYSGQVVNLETKLVGEDDDQHPEFSIVVNKNK